MDFLEFVPDEDLNKLLRARRQEFVQHLLELGYLPSVNADIARALEAFRREYLALGLLPNYTYSVIYDPDLQEEPDSLELELLHELTSLEGEFHIPYLPDVGVQNILSRVLHYRLALFGLFSEKEVAQPFSSKGIAALEQLKSWLLRDGEATDLLKIVYLTGNINDLIRMLVRTDKLRQYLVHFRYDASRKPSPQVQQLIGFDEEMERERAEMNEQTVPTSADFMPEVGSALTQEIDADIADAEQENAGVFRGKIEQLEQEEVQKEQEIDATASDILSENSPATFIPENNRKHIRRERREQRLEAAIETLLEQLKAEQSTSLVELERAKQQLAEQQILLANLQKKEANWEQEKANLKALLDEYKQAQKGLNKKFKTRTTADIQGTLENLHGIITKRQRIIFKLEQQPRPNKNALQVNRDMIAQERVRLREMMKELNTRKALLELRKKGKKEGWIAEGETIKTAHKSLKTKQKELENAIKIAEKQVRDFTVKIDKIQTGLAEEMEEGQGRIQTKVRRLRRQKRRLANMKRGFAKQLQESMDAAWLRQHQEAIFRQHDLSVLKLKDAQQYNQFLIHLLQTFQWQQGYYYGALDGDFGAMTHTSIRDICKDVVGLHHKRILMPLKKNGAPTNTWVLNAAYFFEALAFTLPDRKKEEKEELLEAYRTLENELPLGDKSPWAVQAWEEYVAQIDSDLERGKLRRVYYGARRLGRATWKAIKRLGNWLKNAFKEHLAPIFKNILKHLYGELREGLRTYADGMRFLFGKRLVETKGANGLIISTKYDFDFDAVVAIPQGVKSELLQQHAAFSRQQVANMDFAMRVTGKVLKLILFALKTGVSWQVMAIEIAFDYRKVARIFLRKMVVRAAYHFANKLVLN